MIDNGPRRSWTHMKGSDPHTEGFGISDLYGLVRDQSGCFHRACGGLGLHGPVRPKPTPIGANTLAQKGDSNDPYPYRPPVVPNRFGSVLGWVTLSSHTEPLQFGTTGGVGYQDRVSCGFQSLCLAFCFISHRLRPRLFSWAGLWQAGSLRCQGRGNSSSDLRLPGFSLRFQKHSANQYQTLHCIWQVHLPRAAPDLEGAGRWAVGGVVLCTTKWMVQRKVYSLANKGSAGVRQPEPCPPTSQGPVDDSYVAGLSQNMMIYHPRNPHTVPSQVRYDWARPRHLHQQSPIT